MRRFISNRWWIFILAFGIALVAVAGTSHHAAAGTDSSGLLGDDGGGAGGGVPGTGIGDPDVPTTPGRTARGQGSLTGPTTFGARSVGDGSNAAPAWMTGLRNVLQSLRMRWLGL
ncbi:MAG: hypothetical protein HYR73_01545 [Candidatus Eisenbacteria bacterium]|nr:hypothetical protein [Candidatus Eisenbacteria bacterium]